MPLPHPQAGVWREALHPAPGRPPRQGGSRPRWALGVAPAQPDAPGRARRCRFPRTGESAGASGAGAGRGAAGRGAETLPGASGHRAFPADARRALSGPSRGARARTQRSLLVLAVPCLPSLLGGPRGSSCSGSARATTPGTGRPPSGPATLRGREGALGPHLARLDPRGGARGLGPCEFLL